MLRLKHWSETIRPSFQRVFWPQTNASSRGRFLQPLYDNQWERPVCTPLSPARQTRLPLLCVKIESPSENTCRSLTCCIVAAYSYNPPPVNVFRRFNAGVSPPGGSGDRLLFKENKKVCSTIPLSCCEKKNKNVWLS